MSSLFGSDSDTDDDNNNTPSPTSGITFPVLQSLSQSLLSLLATHNRLRVSTTSPIRLDDTLKEHYFAGMKERLARSEYYVCVGGGSDEEGEKQARSLSDER